MSPFAFVFICLIMGALVTVTKFCLHSQKIILATRNIFNFILAKTGGKRKGEPHVFHNIFGHPLCLDFI